jgi:hypothetical protein
MDLSDLKLSDDPNGDGNALVARIALRHYGEYYQPNGVPWAGWCELFIGDVLAEAGIPHPRYTSAIMDAASGPLHHGRAPAGSLVFFDRRASPDGHVGIALGDGTMISVLDGGIVRTTYEDWPSYLGWRTEIAAPGRTTVEKPDAGGLVSIPPPVQKDATEMGAAIMALPAKLAIQPGAVVVPAMIDGRSGVLRASANPDLSRGNPPTPDLSRGNPPTADEVHSVPRAGIVGDPGSDWAATGRDTGLPPSSPGVGRAGWWPNPPRVVSYVAIIALLALVIGIGLRRRAVRLEGGGWRPEEDAWRPEEDPWRPEEDAQRRAVRPEEDVWRL